MHFTQRSKDIRSIAPIAREWRPDTVFLENDVVMTDDDRLWVCLSRHTSNVRNMPLMVNGMPVTSRPWAPMTSVPPPRVPPTKRSN